MLSETKAKAVAAGIAAGMVAAMGILTLSNEKASARTMRIEIVSPAVQKIAELAEKDPEMARTKIVALYRQDGLLSGMDYTQAAKLVMASDRKEMMALAHDFAIAGLALGDQGAKPLVARTEDRLFSAAGLGERYGTLSGKSSALTERHRNLMGIAPSGGVRSIAEAAN